MTESTKYGIVLFFSYGESINPSIYCNKEENYYLSSSVSFNTISFSHHHDGSSFVVGICCNRITST